MGDWLVSFFLGEEGRHDFLGSFIVWSGSAETSFPTQKKEAVTTLLYLWKYEMRYYWLCGKVGRNENWFPYFLCFAGYAMCIFVIDREVKVDAISLNRNKKFSPVSVFVSTSTSNGW